MISVFDISSEKIEHTRYERRNAVYEIEIKFHQYISQLPSKDEESMKGKIRLHFEPAVAVFIQI